eukprot:COSAG01_NODE_1_length_100484_cov_170.446142_63_plen_159_part_00
MFSAGKISRRKKVKKQKSYYPKKEDISQKWYVIDAKDCIVGRLATEAASLLNGKKNKLSTPGLNTANFVVIINASKVRLSGNKANEKKYYRHSGYTGGLKVTSFKDLLQKKPEEVLRKAILGMLPHNSYGSDIATHVKIYADDTHPHQAQNPKEMLVK